MRTQPSSGRWRMAGFVVVSAVLAACSHTSKPPATAKVTAPSTSATSTTAAPTTIPTTTAPQPKLVYSHHFTAAQQEVAQGYFAAERAFLDASARPRLSQTLLAATHTSAMLAAARGDVAALAKEGEAARLPPASAYKVQISQVTIHGTKAEVELCSVDDRVLYKPATGHIVDSTVISRRSKATLRKIRNSWLLAEQRSEAKRHGVAACQ